MCLCQFTLASWSSSLKTGRLISFWALNRHILHLKAIFLACFLFLVVKTDNIWTAFKVVDWGFLCERDRKCVQTEIESRISIHAACSTRIQGRPRTRAQNAYTHRDSCGETHSRPVCPAQSRSCEEKGGPSVCESTPNSTEGSGPGQIVFLSANK